MHANTSRLERWVSLISSIADSTISLVGTGIVKRLLHEVGDVTVFSFMSEERTLSIGIILKGEAETTTITLCGYHLSERDGCLWIRFDEIITTKPWLTAVGEQFYKGYDVHVPKQFELEARMVFGDPDTN